MDKQAYLIIANGNYTQLGFLVSLLDNIKTDIYILIDRKSTFSLKDKLTISNQVNISKLYFVPRLNIYWGGVLTDKGRA